MNCCSKQKKPKIFSVPIEKELKNVDKNGNENITTISYKTEFINARIMACSLSIFVNNLTEGIQKIKCKDCNCFLDYESVKDNFIKYTCLCYNKDYPKKIGEELKKQFKNIFKFFCCNIRKIVVLLRKVVYDCIFLSCHIRVSD